MVSKVLIANRGAIARRVIRACSEMGKATVALYSDADADAVYLSEASETAHLPGHSAVETYLNQDLILDIARRCGADSVHPGYGFLAENSAFATAAIDAGLTFIGPNPEWLAAMGDKVAARKLFSDHGFPVFAGSGLVASAAEAASAAQAIGYPVMLKPAGGGGGMGMEIVRDEEEVEAAFKRAQAIAGSAFDDSSVYLEQWIDRPRHIEFQILADGRGGAVHAYERECSVQRRNQKLIEESPAPGLDANLVAETAQKAAAVCGELGYNNVGTLETLFSRDGGIGFLEMNTRIQVEHGVTEMVTGLDLVQDQIRLAEGGLLPDVPERNGYAIEARVYAEDAETLLPSTGKLHVFKPPMLTGVRVETGYAQGQTVTPFYDALLAKVIAHGSTRELAIGRLTVALRAFEIIGVKTNVALLTSVLQDAEFLTGNVDTGIVSRLLGNG